ncbi:MAG TPA: NADH-quinone oxidoreductase subunit K [Nitrososphaerales archaeon]|nr:NADH-quinone oxidoreductase subunit K [Nitrososphaerales archaeon]
MATAMAMVLLGMGAISTSKNLLKTVMSFQVVVFGANLALFASGLSGQSGLVSGSLVFFSIAVGASVESVGLAIVVTVFRKYGTLNPSEIRKLRR